MTQSKPPAGTAPAGTDDNDPAEIAKIEADIDQTRNAISGDLRTLGERLSPQHLKEEAKEVMTEAKNVAVETLHEAKNVATSTYREVKDDAMDTVSAKVDEFRDNVRSAEREALGFVRDNAVPLALMGVGLAWFLSNRRSRDARWDAGEIYEFFPVLKEMRKRRAGNLSGGQQQQLAIGRALASNPRVLLLDEPTEGIQPSIIKEIAVQLKRIRDEKGLTILVSEQVLSFALAVADRVAVMVRGALVHESPRADLDEASLGKLLAI